MVAGWVSAGFSQFQKFPPPLQGIQVESTTMSRAARFQQNPEHS